ncbi:MAG: hypothetical protein ACLPR9_15940 [Acidimicrobiales bacterium]|jgi:hypothetical protein
MSGRRQSPTPALKSLTPDERGQLLNELLRAHPELVDDAEHRARTHLAAADADAVAALFQQTLREADADQLALRAGRVLGRGYVEVGEAACEILEELLQSELDDLARRAKLGLDDAAIQIGLGLLRGLAECRNAVIDGTVLAYAGEDVTDGLAWSVCNAVADAKLTMPGDAFDNLPSDWVRSLNP